MTPPPLPRTGRGGGGEGILDAIAAELGDLPLALTLAGSYLDTYRDEPFGQPATYLANLRKSLLAHRSLRGAGTPISLTGHELNVYATIDLSYQRLDPAIPTDALATQALARAACLAPGEPFPRDLLLATLPATEDDTDDEEAAAWRADAHIGVSDQTIYNWIADGTVQRYRTKEMKRKRYTIPMSEVERLRGAYQEIVEGNNNGLAVSA